MRNHTGWPSFGGLGNSGYITNWILIDKNCQFSWNKISLLIISYPCPYSESLPIVQLFPAVHRFLFCSPNHLLNQAIGVSLGWRFFFFSSCLLFVHEFNRIVNNRQWRTVRLVNAVSWCVMREFKWSLRMRWMYLCSETQVVSFLKLTVASLVWSKLWIMPFRTIVLITILTEIIG